MKPLHKMTRKELDKEWTRISVIGRFIPAAETLDISDAMTPEEIESADHVDSSAACPTCGESRVDFLAWDADDRDIVECQTCGTIYHPDDNQED